MKYLSIFALLFNTHFIHAFEFLQEEVDNQLASIQHPNRNWVKQRFTKNLEPILDVAIVGGGQTGLTVAFSLKQHCIHNICVFDKNSEGFAGSWINIGRMEKLRTPKTTTGPDLDIPVLSFKNWFCEKYSQQTWDRTDYIPRLDWHDYLNWFRKVLKLPVEFNCHVGPLQLDSINECYLFDVFQKDKKNTIFARKVILATGLEGSGGWMIPQFVKQNISSSKYSQAAYPIEEASIRDKDVAILGAGPNAFDLALEAYQMGAKSIKIFSKRDKLVSLHCFKWGEFTGFMKCFVDLTDEQKYSFSARMFEMGQPPVPERVDKVFSLKNFSMHYSSPWINTFEKDDKIVIQTPKGDFLADFLILATGWYCQLENRPELKHLVGKIAKWKDKYNPPAGRSYEKLLQFPYLGRGFQFTPKNKEDDFYISSLFNMTGGGLVSNGFCAGTGLTGMKYSIDLITHELCKQFFLEDAGKYYESFDLYDRKDFDENLFLKSHSLPHNRF